MVFEVIDYLLLAGMYFGSDVFADYIKLHAIADRWPFEMEVRITVCSLKPKVFPPCHGVFDESWVIAIQYRVPQLIWVQRRRMLDCVRPWFLLVIQIAHPNWRVKIQHPLPVVMLLVDSWIRRSVSCSWPILLHVEHRLLLCALNFMHVILCKYTLSKSVWA